MALVYVSSSVRPVSTVADALKGLESPEYASLAQDTPKGAKGIGLWLHGAEETRVVPVSHRQADRVAAGLGLKYNQQNVLVWKKGQGDHEQHVYPGLAKGKKPDEIHALLKDAGIEAHTQLEDGDVHVIHTTSVPPQPIDGVLPKVYKGESKLHGGDTREEAQEDYRRILSGGDK